MADFPTKSVSFLSILTSAVDSTATSLGLDA
jgi:hypothetical protein